jgi:hypothetical protein
MFEIGNSLREARLRQRLDFPQVEQATKIRGKYLRALEEERFELLPAQTYVKGFLRTYSEYLGLDGQLYVDEYTSRYVVGEDEVPVRAKRTARARHHRRVETGGVLLALGVIIGVTALVFVAWKFGSTKADVPAAKPVVATKQPAAHPAAPRASLVVTTVGGSSLLQVRYGGANGAQKYDGTIEAGQTLRFSSSRIWFSVDSPEALIIHVNGRLIRPASGRRATAIVAPNRPIRYVASS